MKVAVYTIALNEAKHVKRWYEASKDADYHLIADTGSTDETVKIAKKLGINVYSISIKPWRFDDARNAALALIPDDIDYCISLDMDEVLTPDWKDELQKAYDAKIHRPVHTMVTDFNKDGTPSVEFDANRIHTRNNYRWRYPIHEAVGPYRLDETRMRVGLAIHHLPDNDKSRAQYLDLLEFAVEEDPSARNLYYYGRELYYKKQMEKSTEILKRYVEVSNFPGEKGYAYRYLAKTDPANAEDYLLTSIETFPCREAVLALSKYYYDEKRWKECLYTAEQAIGITTKVTDFMSESWAWGHMAYDLAAISAWQLSDWDSALRYGLMALETSPDDERLQKNVQFYEEKVNGNIQ